MTSPRRSPQATSSHEGFDFTGHMRRLCGDLVARLSELQHVDLSRVAISYRQTRKRVSHGLQASLTPLRFEGGALQKKRNGRQWTVQRLYDAEGREMLYLLNFYLPRFLDQPYSEKLVTVLHELWHISPAFDGDLRRFEGRYSAHTHSQKEYDEAMRRLAERWLSLDPPEPIHAFLRHDFRALATRHGPIRAVRYPQPKLILVKCNS